MDILDVIILCCLALHVTNGQLTETPSNVATKVRQSVSLACAGDLPKWGEFITASSSGSEQEIAIGGDGGDLFDKTKYKLATEPAGNYELTINSPVLSDGGKYRCSYRKDANDYGAAEVIVFESDPTCTTNVTNDAAVEGDYVAYSCEVKYQGRWASVMEWKNKDGVVQAKDESSGNIVKYTYVTELTPADNGQIFTCRTYFDQLKPEPPSNDEATNKPATDNVLTKYSSPQINVYYGPRLLVVDPVQESYYPGDTIKVTADSNPSSRTYEWMNTATNDTLEASDMITITAAMLGSQSLKVIVCNTIPVSPAKTICKEHQLHFTVIMTTTTTTTTPASTTQSTVPPSGGSTTTPATSGKTDKTNAGLGTGVIVAIALGALAFLVIVILIYIFVIRKRKAQEDTYAMHMDPKCGKPVPVDQVRRIPDVLTPPYSRHDNLNETVPLPAHKPEDIMYADLEMMRDNQADLAIDDNPQSRKLLQMSEPGSGVEYALIQPNRKKDRMQ